ncbi:MAG: hypothetical protein FWF59_00295 [Turicibacter sp.]|nr:hypothetical protein [Turicibacter sp.]
MENSTKNLFDSIMKRDENGQEFWYARDLQAVLEYSKWSNFEKVIEKAKISCEVSNINVSDHFANLGKMVNIGSGASKEINDLALPRYACYLIVQNGDPRKEVIALGQTYFAVKTRQQELADSFTELTEDQKFPEWLSTNS